MKLRINRTRAIGLSFVVLTAAAGVNLVLETRAYYLFYSAVDQVQFAVQSVAFQPIGSTNTSRILIQIQGSNPEDYSGLKVTLITGYVYFASLNYTLFYSSPLQGTLQPGQSLPPNGSVSWTLTIPVSSRQTIPLEAFNDTYAPNVTASVSLLVELSTFLDKVLGFPIQLTPILQNATLT